MVKVRNFEVTCDIFLILGFHTSWNYARKWTTTVYNFYFRSSEVVRGMWATSGPNCRFFVDHTFMF
jgi:hypothetical protein